MQNHAGPKKHVQEDKKNMRRTEIDLGWGGGGGARGGGGYLVSHLHTYVSSSIVRNFVKKRYRPVLGCSLVFF